MSWSAIARDIGARIAGRVVDGGDGEYRSVIQIDNGRITHEPHLIVVPANANDVAETVRYVGDKGIRLTTKCGGHSANGYCLNTEGIVLDIRHLNQLSLDRDTGRLKLGMGARWHEVYDYMEMSQTGRIPIGGGCPGVGVSGFLLGGGYSFVSRSYGLGADNLASLTLVTADGAIRTVSATSKNEAERDLFWACRGGGGGNFGIAVEGELDTQLPASPTMLMGQVLFPFFRIKEVLEFYNQWVLTLPDAMAVYGYVGNQPDPRRGGQPVLSLRFTPVFNGPFGEGLRLLQPLLALAPISASFNQMTIPEWEEFIGGVTLVKGRCAYIRSAMLSASGLTPRIAEIFQYYMSRCPSSDTFVVWTHAGGQVSRIGANDTAFAHRNAMFVPEVKAIWDASRVQDVRRNVEWAYDFFDALSQTATGAYLNYIDPLLTDWPSKYHGSNYPKLLRVKQQWDANNLFRFQQGVGSSFQPSGTKPLDLSPLHTT